MPSLGVSDAPAAARPSSAVASLHRLARTGTWPAAAGRSPRLGQHDGIRLADKLLVTSAALVSLVQLGLAARRGWSRSSSAANWPSRACAASRRRAGRASAACGTDRQGQDGGAGRYAILLLILGRTARSRSSGWDRSALWLVLLTALASAVEYDRNYQAAPAGPASISDFEAARQRSRRAG